MIIAIMLYGILVNLELLKPVSLFSVDCGLIVYNKQKREQVCYFSGLYYSIYDFIVLYSNTLNVIMYFVYVIYDFCWVSLFCCDSTVNIISD